MKSSIAIDLKLKVSELSFKKNIIFVIQLIFNTKNKTIKLEGIKKLRKYLTLYCFLLTRTWKYAQFHIKILLSQSLKCDYVGLIL
jgi:uncharacterized protein YutE (UPF0331/DUF86 family)